MTKGRNEGLCKAAEEEGGEAETVFGTYGKNSSGSDPPTQPELSDYPASTYNFVGRILGPRGLTAKQLEAETGCKIMVRGRSSMRDKKKEEQNRGKPNWEHLNEELHVLISVEDTQTRAEIKMRRAVEEVKKLLVPAANLDPVPDPWLHSSGVFDIFISVGSWKGLEHLSQGFWHLAVLPGVNRMDEQLQEPVPYQATWWKAWAC
ncbi:hypothetical protein DNTS_020556 [Danionella cerebrum]|uniref:K Homology domain-containing protein n=1 Tax=Danionella cerebrum TaxID=2873325 RepID=A0A553RF90_9TELE|nr:hypothetical protein DNTS_020556 [Danionella translucida]